MDKLFEDYIKRSGIRVEALNFYFEKGAFADVVKESDDFIPSEEYSAEDAKGAIEDANYIYLLIKASADEK